jgi:DMSO/TMAO reductase YedYZ molybdopterin-dependent catalytic subunit
LGVRCCRASEEEAGLEPSAVEVMPEGLDEPRLARPLPREKALADGTILAHTMNGERLPPNYGYPARVVVPGWAAGRASSGSAGSSSPTSPSAPIGTPKSTS